MKQRKYLIIVLAGLLQFMFFKTVIAGEVSIVSAEFRSLGGEYWGVNVTLQHADTGWEHYADNWRVVDAQGNILGDRVLYHPHVDEQPFTRGLGKVAIPSAVTTVFITAHDKLHGWTQNRLKVDLNLAENGWLRVESK